MDEMLARRHGHVAGHIKGPRPHIEREVADASGEDAAKTWTLFPSHIIGRASTSSDTADCVNTKSSNTCEKPQGSSVATEITIGILIPMALGFICCLVYFHRRNMKRQAMEDRDPHHKSLDFGLPGDSASNKSKRKSKLGLGSEKPGHPRGLSVDMNLSSPYLLPDHVQGSRESMSSLARTLHQADDPYRPVAALLSETGSVNSFKKEGRHYSGVSSSTKRMSRQSNGQPISPVGHNPLRQNSYSKSPLTPSAASSVTAVESDYSGHSAKDTIPEYGPMPPPQGGLPPIPTVPEIRQPAPVAQKDGSTEQMQEFDLPDFSSDIKMDPADEPNLRMNVTPSITIGPGLPNGSQAPTQSSPVSEVTINKDMMTGPAHQSVSAVIEHTEDYSEYSYADLLQSAAADDEERGRGRVRESGLVIPNQDSKRLSVGPRPLPPSEVLEHEDPETRANRIRSFYKEYFEESKGAAPIAPGEYGGDDDNYGGQAAYFDPDSNQFVMPYAQPITRRAMTPPPTGRIPGGPGPRGPGHMGPRGPGGPGPRGPPRNFAGSTGGSSMRGMPMPPRAGSSMSGYGPRPGSSASGRGPPRAGSAMSGKPKKPVAPPSPLNTLPTPGKLTDDHFSLINAADFAPPSTYVDRARGRSQSPLGERRNFATTVPVASPLVGTFDEMAALPSPYALRKSGGFNGLDFAPPKRIRDPEAGSGSDAGSIRSNRSGISRVNENAIRSGAGRLSRLPGDIIFSKAQQDAALKPTFNMTY